MRKILLTSLIIIFFAGCSLQTPKNEWQYKSSNAFSSYTKNFLSDNNALAQNDLKRAIKHAKQSANITQLARIYLGECALNISVGKESKCEKYKDISALIDNQELDAYYDFIILSYQDNTIKNLPKHYREFATHLDSSHYNKTHEDIVSMKKATSSLLAGALIKNHLDEKTRKHLLEIASFHGYKKAVLFWLGEELKILKDEKSIQNIKQKIMLLRSQ
ncbi:MAG: hypothetical protein ACI9TV_002604 [Sulfurimonas sp.]|jgi:hypothetical protein|uniref:hypothetical protein n=1 Tax=Sulfurimonas sp. TaxID=2022749 RepID=UPI0039E52D5D